MLAVNGATVIHDGSRACPSGAGGDLKIRRVSESGDFLPASARARKHDGKNHEKVHLSATCQGREGKAVAKRGEEFDLILLPACYREASIGEQLATHFDRYQLILAIYPTIAATPRNELLRRMTVSPWLRVGDLCKSDAAHDCFVFTSRYSNGAVAAGLSIELEMCFCALAADTE